MILLGFISDANTCTHIQKLQIQTASVKLPILQKLQIQTASVKLPILQSMEATLSQTFIYFYAISSIQCMADLDHLKEPVLCVNSLV